MVPNKDYPFLNDHDGTQSVESNTSQIKGNWFAIQLSPDLVTGELLNIGVGFIGDCGKISIRLLPDTQVLSSIYGKRKAENLGFLLQVTREHFETVSQLSSPAPQIKLGPLSEINGQTIELILAGLYNSIVSLGTVDALSESDDELQGNKSQTGIQKPKWELTPSHRAERPPLWAANTCFGGVTIHLREGLWRIYSDIDVSKEAADHQFFQGIRFKPSADVEVIKSQIDDLHVKQILKFLLPVAE